MTAPVGYRGLPDVGGNPREVAEIVNLILQGKINATGTVTLTAGAATTVLLDARLSGSSWIYPMPLTANAAAEIGAGTLYFTAQGKGTVTINHANNGQTDREFRVLIIG